MHTWREELFVVVLNRGAANASRFLRLLPEHLFGTHVEI
jgi:hypothetical protein